MLPIKPWLLVLERIRHELSSEGVTRLRDCKALSVLLLSRSCIVRVERLDINLI